MIRSNAPEIMEFAADRLVWKGDDPNVDFVLALRREAKRLRDAERMPERFGLNWLWRALVCRPES